MELPADPQAVLTGINTGLNAIEKFFKLCREWTNKLPDNTPAKQEATQDLAQAEVALQLAKVEVAKSLGYRLCYRHFPPGIMLDIRENTSPRWKCPNPDCGDIAPKPSNAAGVTSDPPNRTRIQSSWVWGTRGRF